MIKKQEDDYVDSCSSPSDDISYRDSDNSERQVNERKSTSKGRRILGYAKDYLMENVIGKLTGQSPLKHKGQP